MSTMSVNSTQGCLEGLLRACWRHKLVKCFEPRLVSPPFAGQLVAGAPMDAELADLYGHLGRLRIKEGPGHYYATVPVMADEEGVQPVVFVDVYEEPHAMPVASSVSRFLESYARYLDALVEAPGYETEGGAALTFPWGVPEILARDTRLVALVRAGRFDTFMPQEEDTRAWVFRLLTGSGRHS